MLPNRFRIDFNALARRIADYNRGVMSREDSFGREMPESTLQLPFFAGRVVGALAHTQVASRLTVLDASLGVDGSVIPNRYAGGGDAAVISRDGADGYTSGNGLVTAYVLGRIIGEHFVAALRDNA